MITTKNHDEELLTRAQRALEKVKNHEKERAKIPLKIDDKTTIMISPKRNKKQAKQDFLDKWAKDFFPTKHSK